MTPSPAQSPPESSEYLPDFSKYISLVAPGDIRQFLAAQLTEFLNLLSSVPESESLKKHTPFTWTIKQVVGHITDTERVFAHRAHWIARGNTTPLVSFDETAFMATCNFDRIPLKNLLAEFEHTRRSNLYLFENFQPEAWLRRGTVANHAMTPRALAYAIAGHAKHHIDILRRRLGA